MNDIWLILAQMTEEAAAGWWINFWYRWIVYLAFAFAVVVLFLVIVRHFGSSVKNHAVLNTLSWVVSLSLLLVIPSLLVRILPNFALRLAGLEGVESLQQLSYENNQHLTTILTHLCWQGTVGVAFILVASLRPAVRQMLLQGDAQQQANQSQLPVYTNLPMVQVLDELTPVPTADDAPPPFQPRAMPTPDKMSADEVTVIPSLPLPLAAWLRSLTYKGGNNLIFELSVEQTEIGRQIGHITLPADTSISSNHATIHHTGGNFFIEDRSRFQSTWVNEIQAQKNNRIPLRDGDTVRFGESKFSFHVLNWPRIELLDGESQGQVIKNQATPILIGRGPNNHITIADESVATVQARIELDHLNKTFILRPETNATPGITTVFAENNSGGTELGDPPWRLPPNALVRIGSYSLKITYGQELSPAVESTEQEN